MINEMRIKFSNRANEGFAEKRCNVFVVAYIVKYNIHYKLAKKSVKSGGQ